MKNHERALIWSAVRNALVFGHGPLTASQEAIEDDGYEWTEEHEREACEAILQHPRFAGLALWQLFDTRTYVNVGSVRTKPLGFNFAGLLDAYRRPKLAFGTVRDCFHRLP